MKVENEMDASKKTRRKVRNQGKKDENAILFQVESMVS